MLNIQKFIITNGLQAAINKWGLKVNETEHYCQLNYCQISSPKGIPECDECRGLILDKADWSLVCQPFYRFYNEHEGHSAKIDPEKGLLLEKLDGSLISVWFDKYQGKHVCSTRGRIFADGEVGNAAQKAFGGEPKTFSDLFWGVVNTRYRTFMATLESLARNGFDSTTYMFELIGPENRILTKYEEADMYLLGRRIRDNNGEYVESDFRHLQEAARILCLKLPKVYSFKTREDITRIFEDLNPTDEGFVMVDYTEAVNGNFRRCKIKNPRYLALSRALHAGEGELMDTKSIVNLIRIGETDEVIAYFPEFKDKILALKDKFDKLAVQVDADFAEIKGLEVRKDYALAAQKKAVPNALYALRDGTVKSGAEYLKNMREENLLEILNRG